MRRDDKEVLRHMGSFDSLRSLRMTVWYYCHVDRSGDISTLWLIIRDLSTSHFVKARWRYGTTWSCIVQICNVYKSDKSGIKVFQNWVKFGIIILSEVRRKHCLAIFSNDWCLFNLCIHDLSWKLLTSNLKFDKSNFNIT